MTELYLQKDKEWNRVFFADGQSFRLTRENPYFTQSESYTLDVTLPMKIIENCMLLGNLQRMERSKQPPLMKCRLLVNNKSVLNGTARVTQVTEQAVKIQLVGGNSEANLAGSKIYIDEIDMGDTSIPVSSDDYVNRNEAGVRFLYMQAYDETADETVNQKRVFWRSDAESTVKTYLLGTKTGDAPQPALMDVLWKVIDSMGYNLGTVDPWREPWDRLFVASAKRTANLSHTLPHWTAKEFLTNICTFFNCTLKVDPVSSAVSLQSNIDYFRNAQTVEIEPCDEYTADVAGDNDDSESDFLANADIAFNLSSSEAHDYDCLTETIRDNVPRKVYGDERSMILSYDSMDATIRRKYLFEYPQGICVDWRDENGKSRRKFVDFFRPLIRNNQKESTAKELKIVPVAITEDAKAVFVWSVKGKATVYDITFRSLSLENPTGHELLSDESGEAADIQDLITGSADVPATYEKEDLLQVFFVEDVEQPATSIDDEEPREFSALMPLTDWRYKVKGNNHRHWSLSLNDTDAQYFLGQLHDNGFSFKMTTKYVFKFVADRMPDPRCIFLIRGKRYGCEKIEATVTAEGYDQLMTGYFYEME